MSLEKVIVSLLVAFLVLLAIAVFVNLLVPQEKYSFTKAKAFCGKCGAMMDWYANDTTSHYDKRDGREFYIVEWMCPNESDGDRHTHYGLIPDATRIIYVDEV